MKTEHKIEINTQGEIEKSDSLIFFIVFVLLLCVLYFNPRMLSLLVVPRPLFVRMSVVIFVLTLNMMWLYGIYHFAHIVFSYRTANKLSLPSVCAKPEKEPAAAFLYLTKNDFNASACRTCLEQDYGNFRVFICDDGDQPAAREQIDFFCKQHYGKATLLRRGTSRGFKAGNINDALRVISREFEYIAAADADTMHPRDFLRRIMPYFALSPRLAFVQAKQRSLARQKGYFGRAMRFMIDIHWNHYMTLKNRFGFVMWYGHGAVLRRSAIEAVNGVPEVITEDLAFSSEIRRRGEFGIVADGVVCEEEFPRTIERFRRRNRKWVRGTFEYLLRYYPKLLAARGVSWFEKADVFISAFSLLQAIPFLLLVGLGSFVIPHFYAWHLARGPFFLIPPLFYGHWLELAGKIRYNVFWLFDFYLIMSVVIFFPLLPAFIDLRKDKKALRRYVPMAAFLHLSILFDSAKEIIAYLWTRRTYFYATNNLSRGEENHRWLLAEAFLGVLLITAAFWTYNLWLVSLGISFLGTLFLVKFGFAKLPRAVIPLPFALTALIMIFIAVTIVQNGR